MIRIIIKDIYREQFGQETLASLSWEPAKEKQKCTLCQREIVKTYWITQLCLSTKIFVMAIPHGLDR